MLIEKCMCWCFIDYWIEKCTVKHWTRMPLFPSFFLSLSLCLSPSSSHSCSFVFRHIFQVFCKTVPLFLYGPNEKLVQSSSLFLVFSEADVIVYTFVGTFREMQRCFKWSWIGRGRRKFILTVYRSFSSPRSWFRRGRRCQNGSCAILGVAVT